MQAHRTLIATVLIILLLGVGAYFISKSYSKDAPQDLPSISTTPSKELSLTSKKWTWVNTKMSDGAETTPSTEGKFGLTFNDDLSILASTDCNSGQGSYETGADNSLTIGPLATTLMYCEGSNETAFYQALDNVGSYKISDGQLWLMLKFDSGTMVFN